MPADLPDLYHLAVDAEWVKAIESGAYRRSTIDLSLEEEGYIHASLAEQVPGTADRYYRGRDDIVLLRIDPAKVDCEIRVEDLGGTGTAFPHLYGALPVTAVVSARAVPLSADGTLDVSSLLAGDGAAGDASTG